MTLKNETTEVLKLDESLKGITQVITSLQQGLHNSKAVDSIVMLDLIRKANELKDGIGIMRNAWLSDNDR